MKKVLIVYHSQGGNTEKLARAFFRAATNDERLSVRFLHAVEADLDDLMWCDFVVFGASEYLGTLSGMMKDFFDRTFHDAKSHHLHKPYGVFISAGSDGTRAAAEIDRIVRHYSFYRISEPLIIRGRVGDSDLLSVESFAMRLIQVSSFSSMSYLNRGHQ